MLLESRGIHPMDAVHLALATTLEWIILQLAMTNLYAKAKCCLI